MIRKIGGLFATALMATALMGCENTDSLTAPDAAVESTNRQVAAVQGVAGSASGSAHLTVFPGAPKGLGTRNFAFQAVQDPDGGVRGEWQIVAGGSILHGSIDCLTIAADGESARLSGIVEDAKFTLFQVGTAFAMEVFDNGNGASGDPDVTTQVRAFRNAAPAVGTTFCETGDIPVGADLDPLPTEEGNFSIRVWN